VREITISDENGQQHAIWQTDEYHLQLAAPKLLAALEQQTEAAQLVIDSWAKGDLARAVNGLRTLSYRAEFIQKKEHGQTLSPFPGGTLRLRLFPIRFYFLCRPDRRIRITRETADQSRAADLHSASKYGAREFVFCVLRNPILIQLSRLVSKGVDVHLS
jgi:hypothetical protein